MQSYKFICFPPDASSVKGNDSFIKHKYGWWCNEKEDTIRYNFRHKICIWIQMGFKRSHFPSAKHYSLSFQIRFLSVSGMVIWCRISCGFYGETWSSCADLRVIWMERWWATRLYSCRDKRPFLFRYYCVCASAHQWKQSITGTRVFFSLLNGLLHAQCDMVMLVHA